MDWITIHSVTYPSEAHTIKMQLEVEGYKVYLKDELTVQVDNFYSNAIGGVKIQVAKENAKEAHQFLFDLGYIKKQSDRPSFLQKVNNFTEKIPGLKTLIPELRLMVVIGVPLLILLVSVFYYQPSIKSQLANSEWCIEKVIHGDKAFIPNTNYGETGVVQYRFLETGKCKESCKINEGQLTFPGFNTESFNAFYFIEGYRMTISGSEIFGYFMDGEYEVEIVKNRIVLISDKTKIIGKRQAEQQLMPWL
jgi:hypothetical protein